LFGAGIGVAAASKRQGAAWLYCQWATSKTSQAQQMAGGSGAPTRGSAYDMVKTLPDRAIPDDWIAAVTASSRIAHPCIPEIVAANEFRDVFGVALSNMLTGADPGEQLRHATESFRGVFAKSG
jgi:multiple sugar transport system substrate-binding protein